MARRRVTYLEVAGERPERPGATALVFDLGARSPQRIPTTRSVPRRDRPACPAWLAHLALIALVAFGALLADVTTSPDERRAIERAEERRRPHLSERVAEPVAARSGPIVVPTSSIVSEPWRGVFEHHPDARGAEAVPRVHVVVMAGDGGRALLVVDATRRAFGGPEHPTDQERDARALGPGAGATLRTRQWDAGGYGLSLTTVDMSAEAQDTIAGAVRLPRGASLRHGRPPALDEQVLRALGLAVVDVREGTATAFGSPLIGQAGGASIEGQLHRDGRASLLVSVVQDQLTTAALVREALGPAARVDIEGLPHVVAAAALDHGPAAVSERRIRGWSRLLLDHEGGATIELSSDVLGPGELLDAARAMDLDRLARTTSPMGAGTGSG